MNRTDFIKNLLSIGMMGLIIRTPEKKAPERVEMYDAFVRGLVFAEGRHYVSRMKAGEPLTMKREPKNPYDSTAIALYYDNIKIGYVPAEDNYILSNMLDAGHGRFFAQIKEVFPSAPYYEQVHFCIKSEG